MNEITVNIKNRRSRRTFLDKGIPEEIVGELLDAARYAPSALNKQPWRFIVVSNREAICRLSAIVRGMMKNAMSLAWLLRIFSRELRDPDVINAIKKTMSGKTDTVFYNAPLLIIIAAANGAGRYAARDCAMASQNMMLCAASLGLGSCFIGRADLLAASGEAKKILGLPTGYAIRGCVVFGYTSAGGSAQAPPRKDNMINWVR